MDASSATVLVALIGAVASTVTGLIAVWRVRMVGEVRTNTRSLMKTADEIHILTNSNLTALQQEVADLKADLAVANARILGLVQTIHSHERAT